MSPRKKVPSRAEFNVPVEVDNMTIMVCQLRAYSFGDLVEFSRNSLIPFDGIDDEDDKYDYAENRRLLFFEILYENNSKKVLNGFPQQWKLSDTDGYVHNHVLVDYTILETMDIMTLKDVYLNPGRKLRGWIMFEIKNNVVPEFLVFHSSFFSKRTVDFVIPIKQLDVRVLENDILH